MLASIVCDHRIHIWAIEWTGCRNYSYRIMFLLMLNDVSPRVNWNHLRSPRSWIHQEITANQSVRAGRVNHGGNKKNHRIPMDLDMEKSHRLGRHWSPISRSGSFVGEKVE